jgi:hypothetical protein
MAETSHSRGALAYAGGLYRSSFSWIARTEHRVVDEIHHLEEVEKEGDSGATPFLALVGVILFLLPIFLIVGGLAFLAYYTA